MQLVVPVEYIDNEPVFEPTVPVELVDMVFVGTPGTDMVNTGLVSLCIALAVETEYIEPVAGNALVPVDVDIHIADNVVAALPD